MSVLQQQFIFGETFEGENISINSRNAHLKAPKDSREKVVHEKFQRTALFHYNPSPLESNHRGKEAAKETTDEITSYSVLVLSRTPVSIRLLNYPSLPPSYTQTKQMESAR